MAKHLMVTRQDHELRLTGTGADQILEIAARRLRCE